MKKSEVVHAWGRILTGRAPSISIEITKECPLRCPGCYAFDAAHLGGGTELRQLSDFKGDELVARILAVLDERKPLHVSLVGGDPMVRYRELEQLIPQIESRGIHTQVVTSAVRTVPAVLSDLMGTPQGDTLLFHYYSHREEAEQILRRNRDVRHASDEIMRKHRETNEFASGR